MPMNIETAIKRALESSVSRSLAKVLRAKAESSFKAAFASGSIWSTELEKRLERLLQHRVPGGGEQNPRCRMKGVRYVIDDKGEPRAVLIDLRKQGRLWEDFRNLLISQARRQEPRVPWSEAKQRLR